jgi:hypothetical protein
MLRARTLPANVGPLRVAALATVQYSPTLLPLPTFCTKTFEMLEVTRSLVNRKFRAALLLQNHGGTV